MHASFKFYTLLLISAVLFFLHFNTRFYDPSIRSLEHAWNMGHVVSFFIWTLTWLQLRPNRHEPFLHQTLRVTLITLLAAALIESAQLLFDRSADVDDILKGLLGSLTALVFFSPARVSWPRGILRSTQTAVIALIMLVSYPMFSAMIDEAIARSQLPVLSDFETVFETGRWHGNSRYTVVDDVAVHGRHSLKIRLNTSKYSGITLHHFSESWERYRFIEFSIFHLSSDALEMTCSIHDDRHRRHGMRYHDRFNRRFTLQPGWNTYQIAMEDIRRAPQNREMNLSGIESFSLFATQLSQPETIYVDHVRLIP